MELERLYVNGQWIETSKKAPTLDPSTGQAFGEVYVATEAEVDQALASATQAAQSWRWSSFRERRALLERVRTVLYDQRDVLATLIAKEQGKPITEALAVEVIPSIDFLDYFIREGERVLKAQAVRAWQLLFRDKEGWIFYEPLGVVAVISPWNYPFSIPFLDIIAALFAGNTVVFKPSPVTPKVGLFIAHLFEMAEIPDGLLHVLVGGAQVGQFLVTDPRVRGVLFTGSVATGQRILELAAPALKTSLLELGGKDPAIVLEDADLDRAVPGIAWGALMNTGQTCASIERVYVHRARYLEFVERLTAFVDTLKVGDPREPETDLGPLTLDAQRNHVHRQVEAARAAGAQVVRGGTIPDRPGFFYPPTILLDVQQEWDLMQVETFGPVIPILPFDHEEEAIALANDSRYGLTASIWTRDRKRAWDLAQRLEAGTVTINDHVFSFGEPHAPWGGTKSSGLGRSHGKYHLLDLVELKYVSLDFQKRKTQFWWFPYDETYRNMLDLAFPAFFSRSIRARWLALLGFLRYFGRLRKSVSLWNLAKNLRRLLLD